MLTDTEVRIKESKDLIADRCLIVISLPKDKAASIAIPKPPLKYPPYTLTKVTLRTEIGYFGFLFFFWFFLG